MKGAILILIYGSISSALHSDLNEIKSYYKDKKWDSADSNHVPHDLQSCALPGELESLLFFTKNALLIKNER